MLRLRLRLSCDKIRIITLSSPPQSISPTDPLQILFSHGFAKSDH